MAWFTTDWSSSHHTVRCAHKSGDVINFIIVACRISSRLKWYKNYRNRLRLAKVIVKNKMSCFFMVHIYSMRKSMASCQTASAIGAGKKPKFFRQKFLGFNLRRPHAKFWPRNSQISHTSMTCKNRPQCGL